MPTQELKLDKHWKFCADSNGTGRERGYILPGYDDTTWMNAAVPGTFESTDPGLFGYKGICWYRCRFDLAAVSDTVLLCFEAVNTNCTVWLNGQLAGSHCFGYLPFQLDVTAKAMPGTNTLVVSVDNRLRAGQLPTLHFWRNHGGIIRDVTLRCLDAVYISSIRVQTACRADGSVLNVRTSLTNTSPTHKQVALRLSVEGLEGSACDEFVLNPREERLHEAAFTFAKVKLWAPDQPALYQLKAEISGDGGRDCQTKRFGFRTIETADGQILLNGRPLFLKGFNRHEDSPVTELATDRAGSHKDLSNIKAMGANFVRFCHYPHSPCELDFCDELGLLVMDEIPFNAALVEIPDVDLAPTRNSLQEAYGNARCAVRRLIERDHHHPCVIFWSAGNESNEQHAAIREINRALVDYIRQCDPSRLAVHVSQGCHWYGDLISELFTHDDVICINAYAALEGRLRHKDAGYGEIGIEAFWQKHKARLEACYPGKPVVVTEFGYPTDQSFDSCHDQAVQAELIGREWKIMTPHVNGALVWCYADHEWELHDQTKNPLFGRTISPYGIYQRDRRPKAAAETLKKIWTGQADPAIAGAEDVPG